MQTTSLKIYVRTFKELIKNILWKNLPDLDNDKSSLLRFTYL